MEIREDMTLPTATLVKWGNSLGVRIPGDLAAAVSLAEGDVVEIVARGDALVLRPATPRFTAADLYRSQSYAAWRAAYEGGCHWCADVGREAMPE